MSLLEFSSARAIKTSSRSWGIPINVSGFFHPNRALVKLQGRHHVVSSRNVEAPVACPLLGPLMTFFYACIGTRSRVLRGATLISLIVVVLCGGSLLGLAFAVP